MRYISYRSKLRLRAVLIGALVAFVVLTALGIGVFIYLERYIIYTPQGARLDLGLGVEAPLQIEFDVEHPAPVPGATLTEASGQDEVQSLTQLKGWYADVSMLTAPEQILEAVGTPEEPVAVLLDVRSAFGNFYYPSKTVGAETSSVVDAAAVGGLIARLAANGRIYLVAWLPAFQDSTFALADQSCGLSLSGGALWMDSEGAYWLDPADDRTVSHIEEVVQELAGLGFDEVVLGGFRFPESGSIVYEGDRQEALREAARRLQADLADGRIALSLETTDPTLASFAARIYFRNADGAEVPTLASDFAGAYEPLAEHLVFLTGSMDTRFEAYGLLKPALGEEP